MFLNLLHRMLLNFEKRCILSCLSQFDNRKWGSSISFVSNKCLKPKWRTFLAGHIVALVTNCATKMNRNIFTNDWAVLWNHDVRINWYRVVIMTYQNLHTSMSWKVLETVTSYLKWFHFSESKFFGSRVTRHKWFYK